MQLKQTLNPEVQVTYDIYNAKVYPRRGFFNERGAMGTNESPMHIHEKKFVHDYNTGSSSAYNSKFDFWETNANNRYRSNSNNTNYQTLNVSKPLPEKFDPLAGSISPVPVSKKYLGTNNPTNVSNGDGGVVSNKQTSGNLQDSNPVRKSSILNEGTRVSPADIRSFSQNPTTSSSIYIKRGTLPTDTIETTTESRKKDSSSLKERGQAFETIGAQNDSITANYNSTSIIKPQRTLGLDEPYQSPVQSKQFNSSNTNYYYHFKKNLEKAGEKSQTLSPVKKADARRSIPDWNSMQQLAKTIDNQVLTKLRWRDSVQKEVLAASLLEDRDAGSRSTIFQKNAKTFMKN